METTQKMDSAQNDKEKDDPEKGREERLLEVLRQVVQKCIHQDFSKRPSASEIEEFLKPYLHGEMINGIHDDDDDDDAEKKDHETRLS